MNYKYLLTKRHTLFSLVFFFSVFCLVGCFTQEQPIAMVSEPTPKMGFHTDKFLDAVASVKNAAHMEKVLNDSANAFSELDLDNDGKIDYLKVFEDNDIQGDAVFYVYDDIGQDQTVQLAKLVLYLKRDADDKVTAWMTGYRTSLYADPTSHIVQITASDNILRYAATPHEMYASDYRYGAMPVGFLYRTSPNVISVKRTVISTHVIANNYSAPKITSPGRSSLSSPKVSQRSFSLGRSSGPRRSGFGSGVSKHSHSSSSSSGRHYGRSHFHFGRRH